MHKKQMHWPVGTRLWLHGSNKVIGNQSNIVTTTLGFLKWLPCILPKKQVKKNSNWKQCKSRQQCSTVQTIIHYLIVPYS